MMKKESKETKFNYLSKYTDSDGNITLQASDEELISFDQEKQVSESLFDYLVEKKLLLTDKNDFVFVTNSVLQSPTSLKNSSMLNLLCNSNIESKNHIFIPLLTKSKSWVVVVIQNIFANYNTDVLLKLNIKANAKLVSKIKVIYFEDYESEIKSIKSNMATRMENVMKTILNKKYKFKYDACLKSDKLNFEIKNIKLPMNSSSFSETLIMVNIIEKILNFKDGIESYFNANNISQNKLTSEGIQEIKKAEIETIKLQIPYYYEIVRKQKEESTFEQKDLTEFRKTMIDRSSLNLGELSPIKKIKLPLKKQTEEDISPVRSQRSDRSEQDTRNSVLNKSMIDMFKKLNKKIDISSLSPNNTNEKYAHNLLKKCIERRSIYENKQLMFANNSSTVIDQSNEDLSVTKSTFNETKPVLAEESEIKSTTLLEAQPLTQITTERKSHVTKTNGLTRIRQQSPDRFFGTTNDYTVANVNKSEVDHTEDNCDNCCTGTNCLIF